MPQPAPVTIAVLPSNTPAMLTTQPTLQRFRFTNSAAFCDSVRRPRVDYKRGEGPALGARLEGRTRGAGTREARRWSATMARSELRVSFCPCTVQSDNGVRVRTKSCRRRWKPRRAPGSWPFPYAQDQSETQRSTHPLRRSEARRARSFAKPNWARQSGAVKNTNRPFRIRVSVRKPVSLRARARSFKNGGPAIATTCWPISRPEVMNSEISARPLCCLTTSRHAGVGVGLLSAGAAAVPISASIFDEVRGRCQPNSCGKKLLTVTGAVRFRLVFACSCNPRRAPIIPWPKESPKFLGTISSRQRNYVGRR